MVGLENTCPLSVSAYPVGWRIEVVTDNIYRGHEFVRSEHPVTYPTGMLTNITC